MKSSGAWRSQGTGLRHRTSLQINQPGKPTSSDRIDDVKRESPAMMAVEEEDESLCNDCSD